MYKGQPWTIADTHRYSRAITAEPPKVRRDRAWILRPSLGRSVCQATFTLRGCPASTDALDGELAWLQDLRTGRMAPPATPRAGPDLWCQGTSGRQVRWPFSCLQLHATTHRCFTVRACAGIHPAADRADQQAPVQRRLGGPALGPRDRSSATRGAVVALYRAVNKRCNFFLCCYLRPALRRPSNVMSKAFRAAFHRLVDPTGRGRRGPG